MQRFDGSYVWNWMRKTTDETPQRGLLAWFAPPDGSSVDMLSGVSPTFLASFPSPDPHRTLAYQRKLAEWIPPRYWYDIQYCALTYCDLLSRIWPDLCPMVTDLLYLEWLLHVEPECQQYRDHLSHMFKVACLGTWMLERDGFASGVAEHQFGGRAKSWLDSALPPVRLTDSERRDVVRWAFLLAALFHDFGYGYFLRTKLDQRLSRIYGWLSTASHNTEPSMRSQESFYGSLAGDFVRRHLACQNAGSDKSNDVQRRRVSGFVRDTLTLNHSTASCLFILHLKDMLKNARALNPKLGVAFEIAAEAALIHDLADYGHWCGLAGATREPSAAAGAVNHFLTRDSHCEVPVAVLLMLCDELALWGRPTLTSRKYESGRTISLTLDERRVPEAVSVDLTDTELSIAIHGCNGRRKASKLDRLLRTGHPAFMGRFFGRQIRPVTGQPSGRRGRGSAVV
jgi:hypothetical protein